MKKTYITAVSLLITLSWPSAAPLADTVAVIAHPSLKDTLNADQVRRIYMGKTSQLPSGSHATPVIVKQSDEMHARFARTVLNRSTKQLRSYWAKRLFTGKSKPPLAVQSLQEMKELVSSNEGYIGYMLLSDTDASVKTIFVASNS